MTTSADEVNAPLAARFKMSPCPCGRRHVLVWDRDAREAQLSPGAAGPGLALTYHDDPLGAACPFGGRRLSELEMDITLDAVMEAAGAGHGAAATPLERADRRRGWRAAAAGRPPLSQRLLEHPRVDAQLRARWFMAGWDAGHRARVRQLVVVDVLLERIGVSGCCGCTKDIGS